MNVEIKKREAKGFAIAKDGETKAGLMTFSISGPKLIIIDHTEVEEAYRNKSLGVKLLMSIVRWAREEDIKIIPLCPYANAMFKKMKDIQDVLKT